MNARRDATGCLFGFLVLALSALAFIAIILIILEKLHVIP